MITENIIVALIGSATSIAIALIQNRRRATATSSAFSVGDLKDSLAMAGKLRNSADGVSAFVKARSGRLISDRLNEWQPSDAPPKELQELIIQALNTIINGESIWDDSRFLGIQLRGSTRSLLESIPTGESLPRLNRLLLEDAYPEELARVPPVGEKALAPPMTVLTLGFAVTALIVALLPTFLSSRLRIARIVVTSKTIATDLSLFVRTGSMREAIISPANMSGAHVIGFYCRPMQYKGMEGVHVHFRLAESTQVATIEFSLMQPEMKELISTNDVFPE